MEALVSGGFLETVVTHIKVDEARKTPLKAELTALASAERVAALDASEITRDLAQRVSDVKALLGRHTPHDPPLARAFWPPDGCAFHLFVRSAHAARRRYF